MDFILKVQWSGDGMDKNLINQLLALPGEELHLKKGDFLFHEGDKAEHFYVVVKGRMSIKKFEASGHIFALRLVGPNNVIGEVPLYEENTKTYVFNAIAREDCSVYSIRYDLLEAAIAKDHLLAIAMMKIYTLHMRRQQAKYRDLLLYGKKGAFYSTLLRLANSYGVEREDGIFIDIALTNQELAEFAATSRESLNRMLSELRKLGYVAYDKHHLVICDFDALIGLLDLEVDNIDPNISNIE